MWHEREARERTVHAVCGRGVEWSGVACSKSIPHRGGWVDDQLQIWVGSTGSSQCHGWAWAFKMMRLEIPSCVSPCKNSPVLRSIRRFIIVGSQGVDRQTITWLKARGQNIVQGHGATPTTKQIKSNSVGMARFSYSCSPSPSCSYSSSCFCLGSLEHES